MKRSYINEKIDNAIDFIKQNNFYLPKFAYWEPSKWETLGSEYQELVDNKLGWDMTDFGSDDFEKQGLLLFTLRNGNQNNDLYTKPYAEKVMVIQENQVTPLHYHWVKTEDIINRGGGILVIKLYQSNENDELSNEKFTVKVDGQEVECGPGTEIRLEPGESITLTPKIYHSFWAEEGKVLAGEVSESNDDENDNRFYDDSPRFSEIIEDIEKKYVLVNEY